jgi:flagellar biosynthesis/type III secretory pathway protein FliH
MMNMSSSGEVSSVSPVPVTLLMYPDITAPVMSKVKEDRPAETATEHEGEQKASYGPSAQEIDDLLTLARAEAVAETEKRLRNEYEARSQGEAAKIRQALELFQVERKDYFTRIESDVVHLALAISAKILHREAQVDPMLVTALVRVAVDKLHDGSSVSVRVAPEEAGKWREHLANPLNGSTVEIVEDAHLGPGDCILETDLGSANFSIDAQLKEVEQGFFDLLAQRPSIK